MSGSAQTGQLRAAQSARPRTLALRMDTNNTCNLRCIYCTINDRSGPAEYMSPTDFSRVATLLLRDCHYVSLSCATEPLMSPHFRDFIEMLGTYDVPETHFITNGQLLTEEIIRTSVISRIGSVTLSIDGATSDTYATIRGASLDRVIDWLRLFDCVKREYRSQVPLVRVQYTFFRYNAWEIIPFIERYHWYLQEINYTHLSPLDLFGHPLLERISVDEYREIKSRVLECAARFQIGCKVSFNQFNDSELASRSCQIPLSYRFLRHNGDVVMCDKSTYGNVLSEELAVIERRIAAAFSRENPRCAFHCSQPPSKAQEA